MTHNSVAAAVRKSKLLHQENYCNAPECLWRGPLCPKPDHWRKNGFQSREELERARRAVGALVRNGRQALKPRGAAVLRRFN